MKKTVILPIAAALLLNTTAQPAAAEDLMNLRMTAAQTAFNVDALAEADAVTQGALYIENYSGISQMRVILKSDAPLVIENGDFTRDPSQTGADGNPKVAYFAKYSLATYTRHNETTGRSNLALWYGPETGEGGGNYYAGGEVDQADSSFLQFDIRIPQGTEVGDYTCYISTDSQTIAGTITDDDFFAFYQRQPLKVDTDLTLTPVRLAVYRRGDVDCNGEISIEDAQWALMLYASSTLIGEEPSDDGAAALVGIAHGAAARHAADIDEDGAVTVDDAQGLLIYYARSLVGDTPDWDNIFEGY